MCVNTMPRGGRRKNVSNGPKDAIIVAHQLEKGYKPFPNYLDSITLLGERFFTSGKQDSCHYSQQWMFQEVLPKVGPFKAQRNCKNSNSYN